MIPSVFNLVVRRLGAVALTACLCTVLGEGAAVAHPHVWVTMHSTVLYKNGAIVGLRHSWTFDQVYSEMAIDGLDKNNDGDYSREELAELAKVNVAALKEFDYFTFPKLADTALPLGAPTDYYLEYKTEIAKNIVPDLSGTPFDAKSGAAKVAEQAAKPVPVLTLHFTLPLAKPVLADAKGFNFSVGDPSFFIAFEPAAKNPVSLGEGAPKGCKAMQEDEKVSTDAKPSKTGDLMAGQPSDLSVNIVSAPVWKVTCQPAG